MIVLSLVFGFASVVRYDAYQIKKIRKEFEERLREVREAPVAPGERVGKVTVLIGPPVGHEDAGKVRMVFREHVKPGERRGRPCEAQERGMR